MPRQYPDDVLDYTLDKVFPELQRLADEIYLSMAPKQEKDTMNAYGDALVRLMDTKNQAKKPGRHIALGIRDDADEISPMGRVTVNGVDSETLPKSIRSMETTMACVRDVMEKVGDDDMKALWARAVHIAKTNKDRPAPVLE